MQGKSRYGAFEKTGTPGVYRRVHKYCVRAWVGDRKRWVSFDTLEEARTFLEERVLPEREERRRKRRPSVPPATVPVRDDDRGWVYLIQVGDKDGPVKVGWSRYPEQRMAQLRFDFPGESLSLVGLVPASERRSEGDLHCMFERFWLGGGELFGAGVLLEVERMLWRGWRR